MMKRMLMLMMRIYDDNDGLAYIGLVWSLEARHFGYISFSMWIEKNTLVFWIVMMSINIFILKVIMYILILRTIFM